MTLHQPNVAQTQSLPSAYAGQWYVAAFAQALRPGQTLVKTIADQEIVFWRARHDPRTVQAASAVCPHWGGPLGNGAVAADGALICPWHGWQFSDGSCRQRPRLKLPRYRAYDDGLLLWVRLPWAVAEVSPPPLQSRPVAPYSFWFDIVIESDVYHVQENYLDFLHPAEYHPSVFSHCRHLGREGEINCVELAYKMPWGKPLITRTRVWAPTPYQVRNEVYAGLGTGMVIESHITPLSTERSIIHELYHVPRTLVAPPGWPLMRFFMQRAARKIRAEDALFAARRFQLRKQGFVDGRGLPIQDKSTPYLDEWPDTPEAHSVAQKLSDLVGKTAPSYW